jgi:putative addiction module component (TIGR02574 family)
LVSLTTAERIKLAYDLWDSLDPNSADWSSGDVLWAYSQQRLEQYRRDPSTMVAWEEIRVQLRSSRK